MKKKTIATLVVGGLLAVPMSMAFAGCSNNNNGKVYAANKQEVYAFSALSSAQYLTKETNNANPTLLANNQTLGRPDVIANDINTINNYVGMFDEYLLNGGFTSVISKPTPETDGEEYGNYGTKIHITLPNANGEKDEYVMYYTEINSQTETEIDEDDDETETEIETTLSGVLLFNEDVFEITGEKTIEHDGKDTEVEIEFTTKSKTNKSNYIVVKQEMEKDEIEFTYAIHQNNALQSKTKIEWENENGKAELKMQFLNKGADGNITNIKYTLEQETIDSVKVIAVKYKNGNATEKFTITDNGSTYLYTYANGFSEEFLK